MKIVQGSMQGLPLSAIFDTENCIVSHNLMSKSPEREKYVKVTEEYVEVNNYASLILEVYLCCRETCLNVNYLKTDRNLSSFFEHFEHYSYKQVQKPILYNCFTSLICACHFHVAIGCFMI